MDVIGFIATMLPIALSPGASFTLARRCCSNQGTIPQFGDLIS